MNTVKNFYLSLGYFLYASAILVLLLYAFLEFQPATHLASNFNLCPLDRILFLLLSAIFMYMGAIFITKQASSTVRRKLFRFNLISWLILYLMLLITLTLFDDYSYRDSLEKIEHYTTRRYNFIPLHMIHNYIEKYRHGYISFEVFSYNIIGNIIALIPLSLLLPLIFKAQNRFWIFFITILVTTSAIEILQYVTVSGTCDIDDIILNTLGACFAYGLFQLPPIKLKIQRLFFQNTSTPKEFQHQNKPI